MLSCLPVSLFREIISGEIPVSVWSAEAAGMGLDALDISILFVKDRTPAGIARLDKEVHAGGIPLGMVAAYPDFTNPDADYREKQLIRCLSDISCAADLGASWFRITAGQVYPEYDEDLQLGHVLDAFEKCQAYAEKNGVGLVWENHSRPGAWEHPDFNYETGRLFRMQKALAGSGIRMNYDLANAYLLGLGADFLELCYPDIATIHVNDVASADPIRFAGIGKGKVPVAEMIGILKRKGFRGQISIEEASFEGMEGIRRYVDATGKILSEAGMK